MRRTLMIVARVVVLGNGGGAMDGTGMRLRAGHREAEHEREDHPGESHHTILSFQRPRRNSTALATASVENAIVTAQATPWGPIPK